MSQFITDYSEYLTEKLLADVKAIAEANVDPNKAKPTKKTEVDVDPQLNSKTVDDDEDDGEADLVSPKDKNAEVNPDKKKTKKSSVSEKYDVTFSDKEIAHFDKIINTEGNQ